MSPALSSSRLSLTAFTLAALLTGAAACGKSKPSDKGGPAPGSGAGTAAPTGPADPRSQAIITKSKELRDRACACETAACAAEVRNDHDTWLRGQIDEFAKLGEPTSTKTQQDEASALQRALFACLEKPRTGTGTGAGTGAPAPTP